MQLARCGVLTLYLRRANCWRSTFRRPESVMWLSVQFRVLSLVAGCGVLWSLESLLPLYRYQKQRWRRALPNVGLTILLIITNLALSLVTAGVSKVAITRQFGLFHFVNRPPWLIGLLGVMALDLFTYF